MGLKKLQELSLAWNQLTEIPDFAMLPSDNSLQVLHLYENPITAASPGAFDSMSGISPNSLQKFTLSSTNLSLVNPHEFVQFGQAFHSLTSLALVDCGLKTLPDFRPINRSDDLTLSLGMNRFVCDCRLWWMPDTFNDPHDHLTFSRILGYPSCSSPIILKDRNVNELNTTVLCPGECCDLMRLSILIL
jgi:Leucine-rich repeat (LRR) protein